MRLLELSLRNYRVFEEVDLELPARVIGVFGPNGAGKSTLMESVMWALYARARTKKEEIRTHGVLTDCQVRVVFEHGGAAYEVRRAIKGKGHATEAELFVGGAQLAAGVTEVDEEVRRILRMDQDVFRKSVFAEQKQLDAFSDLTRGRRKEMVLRLLGIKPVDDARATARKAAREASVDADRLAGRLPDIGDLEKALGEAAERARREEEAAAAARERVESARDRAKEAEAAFERLDRVREAVEKARLQRQEVATRAEELGQRRGRYERQIASLEVSLGEVPGLERERASLEDAREALEAARRLGDVTDELGRAGAALGELPEAEPEAAAAGLGAAEEADRDARDRATRAEANAERAAEALSRAQEALAAVGNLDPSQPCPTCGQPLREGYESYAAHCKEEVGAAKREAARAKKASAEAAREARETGKALGASRKVAERTLEVVASRRGLEEKVADLGEKARELAERFGGAPPDPEELERRAERAAEVERLLAGLAAKGEQLAEAEAELLKAAAELAEAEERLAGLDEQLESAAFDEDGFERSRMERDEATKLLEEASEAEREAALGAKEARAAASRLEGEIARVKEIAGQVDALRDEARYLERVSRLLDGFRDHLITRVGPELSREAEALFRELTNHEYDDLKIHEETLAITIADGAAYFPIERFSGSETDLANLALRAAISTHLSRVSGADVGFMVLDEVLGSLDAERKDLMVQAMGRLANRFHQLFIITHAEQVKDQFPASVEVRKVGRRRSEAVLV